MGQVIDGPISPPDSQATVLHLLGLESGAILHDRQGRPHAASAGRMVWDLIGRG